MSLITEDSTDTLKDRLITISDLVGGNKVSERLQEFLIEKRKEIVGELIKRGEGHSDV